jgi:3-carboxy-cis,cis-muconate cycloisomerase
VNGEFEGLFAGLFARGGVASEVGDRALLQAMLDFEVALAQTLADAALIPAAAAREIAAAADVAALDVGKLGRSTGEHGTPVPGLVAGLRSRLSRQAADGVHVGATSQDALDTGLMLVARRALVPLLHDLDAAADACAALAERHRRSLQAGRTLLQQAVPVTFGLKAAGWLAGLDAATAGLAEVRDRDLALALGGAAGTLAAYGDRGLEIVSALAARLELAEPDRPWHTVRLAPARLACALGMALGVTAKIAGDVILLAQTEVAEVAVADGGGSSAMPHKRNPVGAVAVVACARRGPGLVATILASMPQEHERAAGSWQAEWEPLLDLLRLTGSAAAALRELLVGLTVDPEKMKENLGLTRGLVMSESVAGALAESLGRARAQDLVGEAAQHVGNRHASLREALLDLPEVTAALGPQRLEQALAPRQYLGVVDQLIDRALIAHGGMPKQSTEEESR